MLWLRRWLHETEMEQHYGRFKMLRSRTAEMDKQVAVQWRKAIRNGESPLQLADVKCALYRTKFRSTDSENYVDEVDEETRVSPVQSELVLDN